MADVPRLGRLALMAKQLAWLNGSLDYESIYVLIQNLLYNYVYII